TALLLFPALSLLSTGGILLILTNIQVLYQSGISLRTVFLTISSCCVCHIVRTLFLMPKTHIPFPLPEGYRYGLSCGKFEPDASKPPEPPTPSADGGQVTDPSINSLLKQEDQSTKETLSFWSCALSSLFWCHVAWLSLMQLRHYLFIGTLNPTLTRLSGGDPHTVSHYTNIFAVTQFCGVLCAPWNGLIMDRHKGKRHKVSDSLDDLHSSALSLFLTVVQCTLFSLCAAFLQLPALYPTFILQVLNRSFLYGGNAAFLSIAFPPLHFGKLYGLVMSLAAVVSLLQYPAFYIIRTHLQGDPFYVDITLLILGLLAFLHPINVLRVCRRQKLARQRAEAQI
ncbi:equilibrative nucleobase transporter 1, partial [Ascaphus truei]|uniref:equilibrative nucleobase transporter 1 n=1 Tax=Ascaphus truei TaxID=8439 RepID=UPI003F595226